ncbi:MAG: glycoside hydrolase family 3 N-terminal domain-containing protein [Devosia sp.]
MFRSIVAALLALLCVAPAGAQTLEQMAGQMIIVGFQGDDADDKSVKAVAAEIAAGDLGGVMYLKPNVKSLKAVRAMNELFRSSSPGLPPFLTLDQEGGAVERLTKAVGFEELPNAATVAANNSPAEAENLYADMARKVADLGFSVNFGPVADLNVNPDNQVIAKFGRAYGKSAETVAAYDEAFIEAHHAAGLITSLKHFPGHGSSTADSHEGFVDISKTWSPTELEPYRIMFADGYADMVMVGHLYHKDYARQGGGKLPASLSADWIEGVLRGQLGFKGVVVSDDLEMGAIRKIYDLHDTVVQAVNAGTDLLLFSNTAAASGGLADKIRGILVGEAESDPAFRARIEASYARIVALKARIGG